MLLMPGINASAADADWTLFKQRFLQVDGRVIDSGQDGVSHTEGQGMTMLLAVHFNDQATFDKIWQWTRKNLQVRNDKLLAWRWSAKDCVAGKSDDCVADKNNASDGDLFVAWALLRAHRKWNSPDYLLAATESIHAIRNLLLRKTNRGVVLLPGIEGFDKPEGMILNLSYWVFPAIKEIAKFDPAPEWQDLQQTGINLLLEGHFGRWGLPPDWILLGDKLSIAPNFSPRFSYNAVRIPLYLIWSKSDSNSLLAPFKNYWGHFKNAKFISAWTNLYDNSIDSYDASLGIRSIAQLTLATPDFPSMRISTLDTNQDYYSSILFLLVKTMLTEHPH